MSFLSQPISLFSIRPTRTIGPITVEVVLNESTSDKVTVTKQPVQQGASIADHKFKEPTSFSCSIYFRDNSTRSLADTYQDLLKLQNSSDPFDIVTPKRKYSSMVITSLGQTTDKSTENCLAIHMDCEEVIIAPVTTTTTPRVKQANPAVTDSTKNVGKKSAALTLLGGQGFTKVPVSP